jgi:hypothetical protein
MLKKYREKYNALVGAENNHIIAAHTTNDPKNNAFHINTSELPISIKLNHVVDYALDHTARTGMNGKFKWQGDQLTVTPTTGREDVMYAYECAVRRRGSSRSTEPAPELDSPF